MNARVGGVGYDCALKAHAVDIAQKIKVLHAPQRPTAERLTPIAPKPLEPSEVKPHASQKLPRVAAYGERKKRRAVKPIDRAIPTNAEVRRRGDREFAMQLRHVHQQIVEAVGRLMREKLRATHVASVVSVRPNERKEGTAETPTGRTVFGPPCVGAKLVRLTALRAPPAAVARDAERLRAISLRPLLLPLRRWRCRRRRGFESRRAFSAPAREAPAAVRQYRPAR